MIYAGGGVISSNATRELLKFSKHMDIPVCCSMMGLSSVPYDYDLYLGMIGMHGTPVSNYATLNTDLIIAIGARFSDRVAGNRKEFGKDAKILISMLQKFLRMSQPIFRSLAMLAIY